MNYEALEQAFKDKGLEIDRANIGDLTDFFCSNPLPEDEEEAMKRVWHLYWCDARNVEDEDNKYLFEQLGGRELAPLMIAYIKQGIIAEREARRAEDEDWFSQE